MFCFLVVNDTRPRVSGRSDCTALGHFPSFEDIEHWTLSQKDLLEVPTAQESAYSYPNGTMT